MRLMRVGALGDERPVVVHGDISYDVSSFTSDFDSQFWTSDAFDRIALALGSGDGRLREIHDLSGRVGSPVPKPSKIVCIGLNYLDHIREAGAETPTEPVVFMKAPNTLIGPYDDVIIPPGSRKTDYEVELAVVIGKESRYLPDEAAGLRAVGGYMISNDFSEREYQLERGGQWVKGKSFETFNPLGPMLVTPDKIDNVDALDLELAVNGEIRQQSNTSEMLFSVGHIIWYLSQFMVLEPGDLINTGTPPGVALGMDDPQYLVPGDLVEASISGLGRQRTTCQAFTAGIGSTEHKLKS